jgi:tetratricopeptide (TPR) repeat protein
MDAARQLLGVLVLAPSAKPWLGPWFGIGLERPLTIALAVAAAILLALAVVLLYRRRGARPAKAARRRDSVNELKELMRRRLAEPVEAFAGSEGPTVGASEAVEADLDLAAKGVLPEAGWRRGAAKHLLRKSLNGQGPNGALNGSEAAYWRQLGALALLDDTHDALVAYGRAAELAPDDTELQMLLGVLHLRAGGLESAEAAFRAQIEHVNGKDGGEAVRYRAGTMLGDVLLAKGARAEALAAYEAARKEVEALAEREPGNARWQRDASVAHDRIGELMLADLQIDPALESFRRSLKIAEAMAALDPASPSLQHDLSVAHDRIGEALQLKGDEEGAHESYRRSLALAEGLVHREPDHPEWRWDVSVSLDRIGDVLAAMDKTAEALSAYRRGLRIAEALVASEPARLDWQRDLAVTCHKIGTLEARCGHEAEAREVLEQGKAIIARLAEIARYQAQWRADLSKFDAALRSLGP